MPETWTLRQMGTVEGNAAGVFRREPEREAHPYHRNCLLTLRDDLQALGGLWRQGKPPRRH